MIGKKGTIGLIGVGVFVAVAGMLVSIFVDNGIISRIGGIMSGIGGATFGGAIGFLYRLKQFEKNPEKRKKVEIELKDERSNTIRSRAAAKAGDISNWLFLGVAFICIILEYPIWLIFLIIGIFVLKYILEVRLIVKYDKEI